MVQVHEGIKIPERARARHETESNLHRQTKPHDIRGSIPMVDYTNPAKFPPYIFREYPKMPLLDHNSQPVISVDGEPVMAMEPYETANQKRVREGGQSFRVFAPVKRKDHEGNAYSLNKGFLEEYLTYPFSAKKDLIDATSRLYDMEPVPPIIIDERALEPEIFNDGA